MCVCILDVQLTISDVLVDETEWWCWEKSDAIDASVRVYFIWLDCLMTKVLSMSYLYLCVCVSSKCVFVRCVLNIGTINVYLCVCGSPLLLLTSSQSGHLPQSASADFLHTTAHCFNPSSSHHCCNRSKPSKEYSLKTNGEPSIFLIWEYFVCSI